MLLRMRLDRRLVSLFPPGRGLNPDHRLQHRLAEPLSPGSGAEPKRITQSSLDQLSFPRVGG